MGDKTEHLTALELAYIAGLVDGEGSIYMAQYPRHRTSYPAIVVAMTDRGVIDWLAECIGAKVTLHNQTNLRRHPHYKPQYRTGLTGTRAARLCARLAPHLRVKRQQALLVDALWADYRHRDSGESGVPRDIARMLLGEELGYANG